MYTDAELTMLRTDLGHLNPAPAVAEYMTRLLEAAEEELSRKGIFIDHGAPADSFLLVDTAGAMPRMLEYALRNREILAHTGGEAP